jgi:hypothetical protein
MHISSRPEIFLCNSLFIYLVYFVTVSVLDLDALDVVLPALDVCSGSVTIYI